MAAAARARGRPLAVRQQTAAGPAKQRLAIAGRVGRSAPGRTGPGGPGGWQALNRRGELARLPAPTCGGRAASEAPAGRAGGLPRPGVHGLRPLQAPGGRRAGSRPRGRAERSTRLRGETAALLAPGAAARRLPQLLHPGASSRSGAAPTWTGATSCTAPATSSRPRSRAARRPAATSCSASRAGSPTTGRARSAGPATTGIDGHPEIETALVELYRETGDAPTSSSPRQLRRPRGHGLLGGTRHRAAATSRTTAGARGRPTAIGPRRARAVPGAPASPTSTSRPATRRCCDALGTPLGATWSPTKTYLTGGIGSRHDGEAFGDPYELPPDRAYGETCAAIAQHPLELAAAAGHRRGRYADLIERTLYNGSSRRRRRSTAPVLLRQPAAAQRTRPLRGATTRRGAREWFTCACCPPNIMRLLRLARHYVATTARRRRCTSTSTRRRGCRRRVSTWRWRPPTRGGPGRPCGCSAPPSEAPRGWRCGSRPGRRPPRLQDQRPADGRDARARVPDIRRRWQAGDEVGCALT